MTAVVPLIPEDEKWEKFLEQNDHLIFHTPLYKKFVEAAFDLKVLYYAAVKGETIRALLPVFPIQHKILSSKLISTAFLEYGGPCGDGKSLENIVSYLEQNFGKKYTHLEIRAGLKAQEPVLDRIMKRDVPYKRFVLELGSENDVWRNIQREKRKAVRKAERLGIVVREVPYRNIDALYDIYCRNMKDFGSPPFGRSYFESFFNNLVSQEMGKIFGSYHQGRLVSFLSGLCYRDRIHIVISVARPEYLKYRINDAMHWAFIRFACHRGFRWFDFGRVRPESGQYDYKKKWGCTLHDLPHHYLLWKSKRIPCVDPENPKYRMMTSVWRRLPLSWTTRIGPWIRKGLGI
ncbi:MAG: GNAT family N-acetyltransferase [Candidatus Aminicenantes bacterium]|nr:GNAT family N-acetyltransferase [Candidatus Aminicenantes bacterium]